MASPPRLTVSEILETKPIGTTCFLYGWIKKPLRSSKTVHFAHVHDGSTPSSTYLQVVLHPKASPSTRPLIEAAQRDVAFGLVGEVVASKGKGQEVEFFAKDLVHLGPLDPSLPYPVAVETISLTDLRTLPHLRPRLDLFQDLATVRSKCILATHVFFDEQGYRHIQTPCITGSDCEGAGEMFSLVDDPAKPFFKGSKPSLTVSGQLDVEPFAMSLGKVYTCGPTFRAEESDTSRHLSEFWMVEPELIGSLADVMSLAEAYVKALISKVSSLTLPSLTLPAELKRCLDEPFGSMTYTEALELLVSHEDSPFKGSSEIVWGMDLGSAQEKWLSSHFGRPLFVTHYPAKIKAFYMRATRVGEESESKREETVEAFDLLVPGLGELIGGSAREEDFDRLAARIEEEKLDPGDYKAYLDLRRFGSMPHGGFGLGFERFVSWISGVGHLREVTPYVRAYGYSL